MLNRAAAWIDDRPSLRAAWLGWSNAAKRWPLAGVSVAAAIIALAALGRNATVSHALASAAGAPLAVGAVAAALFAMAMLRRGRRLARERHRDWLAAVPSDLSITARAACAPLLIWGAAAFVTASAAAVAELSAWSCAAIVLTSGGGCVAAIAIVALVMAGEARRARRASGASQSAVPRSQYAIVRRPRRRWATNASLLPLGYWPVAHARFLDRPKIRARSIVLLLLGLPMGVAGAVALAASVFWLIVLHFFNLLIGVVRVAFAASWWLAPTPVRAARFTVAVIHRALAAQLAACALALGAVYAIAGRAAWHSTLLRVLVLMGAACVVSAGACVAALRTAGAARSGLHRWIR